MTKFILVILSISLFSCEEKSIETSLEGTWHLANYNGGLAGVSVDVARGAYTFTFDSNKLIIENAHESFVWIEDGTYAYKIEDVNSVQSIRIDGDDKGVFIKTGNQLSIDQRAYDGFEYVFKK